MARNDDGDWVVVIGHSYSAEPARTSNYPCQIGVGTRLPIGDLQQSVPAAQLEICAVQVKCDAELSTHSAKIFIKFAPNRRESLIRFGPVGLLSCGGQFLVIVIEVYGAQSLLGGHQHNVTNGRGVGREVHLLMLSHSSRRIHIRPSEFEERKSPPLSRRAFCNPCYQGFTRTALQLLTAWGRAAAA